MKRRWSSLLLGGWSCLALQGCGGDNTASNAPTPGRELDTKTRALDAGAALLQDKAPIAQLNAYLDGFHFVNGNMQAQMEAHHYCSRLNQEVIQCVIYDSNVAQAKLIGVEYIISQRLFNGLEAEEKHLWHSHVHEVRSGQLIAPGIPDAAEHELMEQIATTYGKTWHLWHTEAQALPLGAPMLMMGFTQDGQLDPKLLADRDRRFGVSSEGKRRARTDIAYPAVDVEADAWQRQVVMQLQATRMPVQISKDSFE